MPLRSSHRTYNRISVSQDSSNVTDQSTLGEPLAPSSSSTNRPQEECDEEEALRARSSSSSSLSLTPLIQNEISVVLLDGAQSKFIIKCDPKWKVSEFKAVSAAVTKVPPQSQRLIHMGKLLQDEKTLDDFGIDEDDKIIHLFPKPNVVINAPSSANDQDERDSGVNSSSPNNSRDIGGAHVPQIILDAEEASRRSQILVLSSQEIFEAQHRVKIFSFLLMIISSMELLQLMTLFVGVAAQNSNDYGGEIPPGNPTDAPPSGNSEIQLRTWQNSDYADAMISSFGFYVSLLGIKATTENTLQLARRYFGCLIVTGIAYNCYYYYLNVRDEEKIAQERNIPFDDSTKYSEAFVGILAPLTIWVLCIIRAYQFQTLLREAETEAEERTRGLVGGNSEGEGGDGEGVTSSSLPYGSGERGSPPPASSYNDLELQVERGVSA